MRNVSPPAARAAPICSGTDDAVSGGRSVRASSKRGAIVAGRVVDVNDVVVVTTGCVVVGMARVMVLRVGTVAMRGVADTTPRIVSPPRIVAPEAAGGIASVSAPRTSRPRRRPGAFIWTDSRALLSLLGASSATHRRESCTAAPERPSTPQCPRDAPRRLSVSCAPHGLPLALTLRSPGASSRGPHVLDGRPEAILTILRSAGSASPDPLLGEVL